MATLELGDALARLRVLPAGTPSHDDDFLLTGASGSILGALQEESEFLVVDAPPLLEGGNPRAINIEVDSMLLVVRAEMARKAAIEELKRRCPALQFSRWDSYWLEARSAENGRVERSRRADGDRPLIVARPPVLAWVGAAFASVLLGWAIAINPQVAFIGTVAFLGVAALAAPAGAWVLCALIAALTFRGLVELEMLPSVATFIDLPLAWGALAVALIRNRPSSLLLRRHLRWLGALGLAVVLAWAFHPSEVLRPVLYLALLGEPFAIVGALLADPPSERLRRLLQGALLVLLIIQIPIAGLQFATLGPADSVQGTLYGAGAGAHVISGVVVVGAIWILGSGVARRTLGPMWLPALIALFVSPSSRTPSR